MTEPKDLCKPLIKSAELNTDDFKEVFIDDPVPAGRDAIRFSEIPAYPGLYSMRVVTE